MIWSKCAIHKWMPQLEAAMDANKQLKIHANNLIDTDTHSQYNSQILLCDARNTKSQKKKTIFNIRILRGAPKTKQNSEKKKNQEINKTFD